MIKSARFLFHVSFSKSRFFKEEPGLSRCRVFFAPLFFLCFVCPSLTPLFAQGFGAGRGVVARSSVDEKNTSHLNSGASIRSLFESPRTKIETPDPIPSQKVAHNFPHKYPPNLSSRISPAESVPPDDTISISVAHIRPAASSKKWDPATDPHPSIARIISFDKGDHRIHSFGSGTYLQDFGNYGVIITNWHVVRESAGLVQVHFPNGFTSYAAIVTFDSVWDLAVLLLSKPPEEIPTVKIATAAPRIGDPLWIAGYGGGKYRLVGGRCTKYLSPVEGYGAEFVDVAVDARKGDSGGPIFNRQGELAGVLFGSDNYNTAGSYCARVRKFLDLSKPKFAKIPARPEELFAAIEPKQPKHSLNEGAEIFRRQVIRDYNKSRDEPTVLASSSFGASNPRNGRGSSTSRDMKQQRLNVRPADSKGNLTFYPDFPDFYQNTSKAAPDDTTKIAQKITKGEAPSPQRETPHIISKKELIAKKNAAQSDTAKPNAKPNGVKNKERTDTTPVKEKVTPTPATAYQTVSDDSTFTPSVPNAKYAASSPVAVPESSFESPFEPSGVTPLESELVPQMHSRTGASSGNFFNTLKIIAIIVVAFFVVFHLVKLMSIIEENDAGVSPG